jgi:hypothetical protein
MAKNSKKIILLPTISIDMAKLCPFAFLLLPLLFSCAGLQDSAAFREDGRQSVPSADLQPENAQAAPVQEREAQERNAQEHNAQERPAQESSAPVPERQQSSIYIMGKGRVDGETLALFLMRSNPLIDPDYARVLSSHYINEAAYEGINHDVAFAQMCLETGFLRYGGLVQSEWNNFCGLGAIGPEQPGLIFPDPQTGVRAHIQHLKAYATEEPLFGELVDPRYRYVRKGSSPTIEGLSGTWAVDRQYSVKISAILRRLYEFSF